MSQIAFIGLGNMGGPMAKNLIKAGHNLAVFDVNPDSLPAFEEIGAKACSSAVETLAGADFVISMLPNGAIVEELYLGPKGLLASMSEKSLIIDCSTIAPQNARRVATAASENGIKMIDAPVSGGTAGAAAGTLSFIVGGPKEYLEKARPVLSAMGKNIFHAGDAGAGQVAKICNNMLLAIHMTGTAEAINLGVANGLDPNVLSEIMNKSSGANWSLDVYNPWPGVQEGSAASRDYSGGFGSMLMLKDLGLALEAASATNSSIPLGSHVESLYRQHCETENKGLDFSSIVKSIKAKAVK